jgi:hypothetical protein
LRTHFDDQRIAAQTGSGGSTQSGAERANFDTYLEGLVKMSTNATFSGARQEANWWGKYRDYKSDGKTVEREEYRFYIMYTMEKKMFLSQLEKLLADAADATYTNTAEKNRAIEMVRNSWNSQ